MSIHRAAARGVERHPIRDAVLIGRGLARGPSAKEGLGLEGHTVRNLDRIAFVDGAFRGGFCAVGGVANRRAVRGARKLDALRTGVRAGSEARHRRRRLPVRSDMHGYLDRFRRTGRVDIGRVADPTLRSQGLSAQVGRIKTIHPLPFDVYQIGLATGKGHAHLARKAPVALAPTILDALRGHGIFKGDVDVIERAQRRVHVRARLRKHGVQVLGAVPLRDPCRVVRGHSAVHVKVKAVRKGVLHALVGSASCREFEGTRVDRKVRGLPLLVARGRPGDPDRTVGGREVLRGIGPGALVANLDLQRGRGLGKQRAGTGRLDLQVDRRNERRVHGGDLAAVRKRIVGDGQRFLRKVGALGRALPFPMAKGAAILCRCGNRDGRAQGALHLKAGRPVLIVLSVVRGIGARDRNVFTSRVVELVPKRPSVSPVAALLCPQRNAEPSLCARLAREHDAGLRVIRVCSVENPVVDGRALRRGRGGQPQGVPLVRARRQRQHRRGDTRAGQHRNAHLHALAVHARHLVGGGERHREVVAHRLALRLHHRAVLADKRIQARDTRDRFVRPQGDLRTILQLGPCRIGQHGHQVIARDARRHGDVRIVHARDLRLVRLEQARRYVKPAEPVNVRFRYRDATALPGKADRHVFRRKGVGERHAGLPVLVDNSAKAVLAAIGRRGDDLVVLVAPKHRDVCRLAVAPAEHSGSRERLARRRLVHGDRHLGRACKVVGRELHVALGHGKGQVGVCGIRHVRVKGHETHRIRGGPALERTAFVGTVSVHGHRLARLVAAHGLAVERHRVLHRSLALPDVAAFIGSVAHVIAVQIDKERVPAVVGNLLTDAAVARDAGADTDLGLVGHVSRNVGANGAAHVVAQEEVVGIAGVLAARVVRDDHRAEQLDVVLVGHVDAAALVVLARGVAIVVPDGAVLDGVVLVADVDAAALAARAVARDGAVLERCALLVELHAAAVVERDVVNDIDAPDQALVGTARHPVDVDAAAAVALFVRPSVVGNVV